VFENIGDDEPASFLGPVHVDDAALPVIDLDLGQSHSCALLENGLVRCWGAGSEAQLGIPGEQDVGDDELPSEAPPIDLGEQAVKIAAGEHHTCAITVSDGLRCWGQNDFGQLGYGHTERIGDDEHPSAAGDVPVGLPVIDVAAGSVHTCVVTDIGTVHCWGHQGAKLGTMLGENIGDDETPGDVGDVDIGGPAIQVAVGKGHSCALLETGEVRCWGNGASGRLGLGSLDDVGDDEPPSAMPPVQLGERATQIAVGGTHACARLESGAVRCWGNGGNGRLGYGMAISVGDDEHPADLPAVDVGGSALLVTAGEGHSCAMLEDERVRCWGSSLRGQLGYGNEDTIGDDESPVAAGDVPYL
jgi:alpha-tubulin suppressor-like RCC1 family protein